MVSFGDDSFVSVGEQLVSEFEIDNMVANASKVGSLYADKYVEVGKFKGESSGFVVGDLFPVREALNSLLDENNFFSITHVSGDWFVQSHTLDGLRFVVEYGRRINGVSYLSNIVVDREFGFTLDEVYAVIVHICLNSDKRVDWFMDIGSE